MKLEREKLYPWLAMLRAKFMGSGRAVALEKHFGSIEKALHASPDAIAALPYFNREMGASVQEAAKGKFDHEIDKELNWAEREGVVILLYSDPEYPYALLHIPAFPAILYVKGTLNQEDLLALAIVGSRRASDAGRRLAGEIACELAEAGLTIVSGLAWGVDAAAHMGALRCKTGRTLAVMGNGLSIIYPREHKVLAEQVMKRGALMSELFYDVAPQAQNFPPRNRIISGLSLGTLVVEAPGHSGALITANYALEQGREVFALPGALDQETSIGTNKLIQDSAARLVTSAKDIWSELEDKITYYRNELTGKIPRVDIPPYPGRDVTERTPAEKSDSPEDVTVPKLCEQAPEAQTVRPPRPNLSSEEEAVMKVLTPDPIHIDTLCRELQWPVAKTSSALGLLELKDLVERTSGMRFRVKAT